LEGIFHRTNVPGISLYRENFQFYYKIFPELGEMIGINPPLFHNKPNQLYPVVLPAAMSVYCATYSMAYLKDFHFMENPTFTATIDNKYYKLLLAEISIFHFRSYLTLVAHYLNECLEINPKQGVGQASVLWGMQTLPAGLHMVFRMDSQCTACDTCSNNNFDSLALNILPFLMTSAYDQFTISVHPENDRLVKVLKLLRLDYQVHDDSEFEEAVSKDSNVFKVLRPVSHASFSYPLISQFISLLFPFGHIKSGTSMDKRIFQHLNKSEKWLKLRNKYPF